MTTKDIINQMEKEFDKITYEDKLDETRTFTMPLELEYDEDKAIKSFIHSYTRTLLESFGEEIIKTRYKCGWRHDEEGAEYDLCDECRAVDEYKAEQRLKMKEIISSIEL